VIIISQTSSTHACPRCVPLHAAKVKGVESSLQQREIQLQQEVDKRTEVRRELDAKLCELREKDRALADYAAQQLVSAKEVEGMRAHLATMNHEQEKHRRARAEQVLGLLQQVRGWCNHV
jgi:thioredoxin-like negative regulator of GroEL